MSPVGYQPVFVPLTASEHFDPACVLYPWMCIRSAGGAAVGSYGLKFDTLPVRCHLPPRFS